MKQFIFFSLILISINATGQTLPKKPTESDIRSYNQLNLMKVDTGMTKAQVVESMGGIKSIQSYVKDPVYWLTKPYDKSLIINNPYSRDMKTDSLGNTIEILWYYTDRKIVDGAITKDELTPIIFEKGKVVGIGWGFYEDYSKRKELNIITNR
jgi:hypothetical protein